MTSRTTYLENAVLKHINAFAAMDLEGVTAALPEDFNTGDPFWPDQREGLRRLTLRMHGALLGLQSTVDELHCQQSEVLTRVRTSGRLTYPSLVARSLGSLFEFEWTAVWRFRDNSLTECRAIVDRYTAMRAMGIAFGAPLHPL